MATCLTPFIVMSNIISPFIGGKVMFLRGISFLVFLLITCILLFSKEKEEIFLSIKNMVRSHLFLALSANIFLLILSTVFAFDHTVAFFGDPQRSEGFLTIFSIFTLFISLRLLFNKKDWEHFFALTSLVAIVLFFIELWQALSGTLRPEALSGNPDFLAIQYLFSIFAGLYIFQIGRSLNKKWYSVLGLFANMLSVFGILLSKTRGPLVGLVVSIVACSIIAVIIGKEKIIFNKFSLRKLGLCACASILLFLLILGVTYNSIFWHKIPGINRVVETSLNDGSMRARVLHLETSINIFKSELTPARVLFGWGWDNYIFAWSKYYNPKVFYYDPAIADRAHNKIMDLLVMSGSLGLLSYLSIWFFAFRRICLSILNGHVITPLIILFFLIAYFISLLFVFDTAITLFAFFAMLAFLSCLNYEKKR